MDKHVSITILSIIEERNPKEESGIIKPKPKTNDLDHLATLFIFSPTCCSIFSFYVGLSHTKHICWGFLSSLKAYPNILGNVIIF